MRLRFILIFLAFSGVSFFLGRLFAQTYPSKGDRANEVISAVSSTSSDNNLIVNGILRSMNNAEERLLTFVESEDLLTLGQDGERVVVFMDLTCTHCKRFNQNAISLAQNEKYQFDYIHKVKYSDSTSVYKHRLLECGNAFGIANLVLNKVMYDLPANETLELMTDELQNEKELASFSKCIDNKNDIGASVSHILKRDSSLVEELEVSIVPTWMINKKIGVGNYSFEVIRSVFDSLSVSSD